MRIRLLVTLVLVGCGVGAVVGGTLRLAQDVGTAPAHPLGAGAPFSLAAGLWWVLALHAASARRFDSTRSIAIAIGLIGGASSALDAVTASAIAPPAGLSAIGLATRCIAVVGAVAWFAWPTPADRSVRTAWGVTGLTCALALGAAAPLLPTSLTPLANALAPVIIAAAIAAAAQPVVAAHLDSVWLAMPPGAAVIGLFIWQRNDLEPADGATLLTLAVSATAGFGFVLRGRLRRAMRPKSSAAAASLRDLSRTLDDGAAPMAVRLPPKLTALAAVLEADWARVWLSLPRDHWQLIDDAGVGVTVVLPPAGPLLRAIHGRAGPILLSPDWLDGGARVVAGPAGGPPTGYLAVSGHAGLVAVLQWAPRHSARSTISPEVRRALVVLGRALGTVVEAGRRIDALRRDIEIQRRWADRERAARRALAGASPPTHRGESLDLEMLLTDVRRTVRDTPHGSGIEVHVSVERPLGRPLRAWGDPDDVGLLVATAARIAITELDGWHGARRIDLAAAAAGDGAELQIADSGAGRAPEARGEEATDAHKLIQWLADRQYAAVQQRADPGVGTVYVVTLFDRSRADHAGSGQLD